MPDLALSALALTALALWATLTVLHLQHHPAQRRALILWTVGLAHLAIAFNPRTDLPYGEDPLGAGGTANSPIFLTGIRLDRAIFVVAVVATLTAAWRTRRPDSGRALWAATLALAAAACISSVFGTLPAFDPLIIGIPALATCLYLDRAPLDWTTRHVHRITLVWTAGSLAAWVVAPDWANLTSTATYTSFLDRTLRLRGITDHPNHLGAMAALGLLLSVWRRDTRWRPLWIAVSAAALILSGSRTSLAAATAAVGLAVYFSKPRSTNRLAAFTLAAALIAVPIAASLSAETIDGNAYLAGATTLQGRTDVWDATLAEFAANPIAGYGPDLWSPRYMDAKGPGWNWVGQAHSQYVEALGGGGLIGFAALAAFCLALLATGWHARTRDHGLAFAAAVGLCVEMTAESVLSLRSFPPAALAALVVAIVYASSARSAPLDEGPVSGEREPATVSS